MPRSSGRCGYRLVSARTVLSFLGSAQGLLLRSQLGRVLARCAWAQVDPSIKPIAQLSFLSSLSSLLLLEMGMKLSGLRNLNHSQFSALGVIY